MGVDVYSDLSYHLLASFRWRIYHGVEGSKFNVVDGTDWIPTHVQRGLDEVKIVVSWSVLMSPYQFFGALIEVSNMVESGVRKYEL